MPQVAVMQRYTVVLKVTAIIPCTFAYLQYLLPIIKHLFNKRACAGHITHGRNNPSLELSLRTLLLGFLPD